ncbi:lytic transglycosylase domain-containing protein [Uliginosibacterium gangwonense]|uniref:lytic transglycosylase domain-containing protein n=1 Tax=Uliginosibacterium gangwonense TaxID=392736 RepID=UPI000371F741|nr:lytic transglycosylase domain-containing protein [Uliginosibacterium gangwonense]
MKFRLCAALAALLWLTGPVRADSGDERILAARDAASRGDTQRLSALASTTTDHALEPYLQYWILSARVARTSDAVPVDTINDFLQRNNNSWLAEKLRQEWLKRLAREGNWPQFEAEYLMLAQPDQDLQCNAIIGGGAAAIDAQRALEAQWLTLVDTPDSCAQVFRTLVSNGRFSTEDVWQRFRRQVEAKRHTGARQTLGWLPDEQAPSTAALTLALENPVRYLATAAAQSPAGRPGRELGMAAVTRLARNDARDALARWRNIDSAYRDEDRAYVAGQLGWMAAVAQLGEALPLYTQAKGVAMSDEQRAWYARAALRAGDWAAVRLAIEAMPQALREQPEWSYWFGRALSQSGRAQDARNLFSRYAGQPNFYGILSAEALGQNLRWPSTAAPASAQELARVRANASIRRAEALLRLDMRTESVREWNWAMRGADDRFLLASAEYARRIGLYDRAINAADRTRDQHDYALRYLAPYYDTFARQANERDLNLSWVYGLVRQESRFLPVARSGPGAQGLMQVMPATGRWIAKREGWRDYDSSWLTQIETNVQLGCAYLRHVMDTLGNQMVVASAAYNAGPGRARRWRDSRPMEGAIYAETIPIPETRDYVKKVMANSVLYETLLSGRSTSLIKRLGKVITSSGEIALSPDEP